MCVLLLGLRKGKVCETLLGLLKGLTPVFLKSDSPAAVREGPKLAPFAFHSEDLVLRLVGPTAREQMEAYGLYV